MISKLHALYTSSFNLTFCFDIHSFSRKIKKRPSIFRSRFAKKEKEKDSPKPDKKRSKSQDWDSSRKERVDSTAPEKEKKKGKLKDKEKDKMLKKKAQSVSGATAESGKKAEEGIASIL